jgi:hypothetical protein
MFPAESIPPAFLPVELLREQEEHGETSTPGSATRGDSSVSLVAVSLVAVWLFPPSPITIGILAGRAMASTMSTPIKQNILLFISILLVGLISYYLRNITFVYI